MFGYLISAPMSEKTKLLICSEHCPIIAEVIIGIGQVLALKDANKSTQQITDAMSEPGPCLRLVANKAP